MPTDHEPQHTRRPHPHRGRRGQDRRGGGNRRPQAPQQEQVRRDQLDVEQLMREIRSRVSAQHGIDLSNQQIQELAARRLEAILDPRSVKPSLMDELRRSAGITPDARPTEPVADTVFDESALYESSGGLLRFIRKLLNPLLRLLINPTALAEALSAQARMNHEAAVREAEQRRRQAEWNGLHYEILRRLVLDIARADIERQDLTMRVESLAAKVDFNERRVRSFEQAQVQTRPAPRTAEPVRASASSDAPSADPVPSPETGSAAEGSDATRRRRRRRRGRRPGGGPGTEAIAAGPGEVETSPAAADGDEPGRDDQPETDTPQPRSEPTVIEHAGVIESTPSQVAPSDHPPAATLQPTAVPPADAPAAPSHESLASAPTIPAEPSSPAAPPEKTDPSPFDR